MVPVVRDSWEMDSKMGSGRKKRTKVRRRGPKSELRQEDIRRVWAKGFQQEPVKKRGKFGEVIGLWRKSQNRPVEF